MRSATARVNSMKIAVRHSSAASLLLMLVSVMLASCGSGAGHGGGSSGGHAGKESSGSHSDASGSRGGTAPSSQAATNAKELLDLLEIGGQQDPSRFVEVEIGSFRVTHRLADEKHTMLVKFRLVGIVPETKQEYLGEELPKFEKRIRDAVISLVQKTDVEQLAEPGLKWLKAELVAAINRVVQDRALQDVVFSDFSMEEV
jgi:flagellar basal body-associated protein FliL